MIISQIIAALQKIKDEHGDIPVDIYDRYGNNRLLVAANEVSSVEYAGKFGKDGHKRAFIANY